jgi:hypothetical protein
MKVVKNSFHCCANFVTFNIASKCSTQNAEISEVLVSHSDEDDECELLGFGAV